jgi:succinate dehydrogenase flavin-adding protein (antitoxin of CptAB toxin-antitoxin module)
MIGKMLSFGFDMATLPARLTYKSTRAMLSMPGDFNGFMDQLREASDEVAREIQLIMDGVDAEMSQRTANLSPRQKQEAAELALGAAEKHLSMAAVNMFRALWLTVNSTEALQNQAGGARERMKWADKAGPDTGRRGPVIIEQDD